VAVLWNAVRAVFKETQAGGQALGIEVQSLDVRDPDDFDRTFDAARRQLPEALITVEDPLTVGHRELIADFAVGQQLPSLDGVREFAAAGGLMSYGASLPDLFRRAADYVDKRGAKPADLPVEQPTTFELVINLTTAKALGLSIPESFLLRADEVIE
jgi:putative tryptophan/tyrosine transport system substrate-binding protein